MTYTWPILSFQAQGQHEGIVAGRVGRGSSGAQPDAGHVVDAGSTVGIIAGQGIDD